MKPWIGKVIIAIGIIHNTVGFIFLGKFGKPILMEGIFNTVNGQLEREAFFWFMFGGIAMILVGALINWIEKSNLAFPKFISWSLLAVTLTVVIIMPLSGGWFFWIPTIGAFRKSK